MYLFWFLLAGLITAEQTQASLEPPPEPAFLPFSSLKYAAVFDVGSTGTRVHVHAYEWKPWECFARGAVRIKMPGWTHKVEPGLAAYYMESLSSLDSKNGTEIVEKYLAPIRRFMFKSLGEKYQPILYVRATGGFRYLIKENQARILDDFHRVIDTWHGITKREWLRVLSGDEEGAFSWLAINQLARRFYDTFEHVGLHPHYKPLETADRPLPGSWLKDNWRAESQGQAGRRLKQRVGMVEVGGASAQVVVEPPAELKEQLSDQLSITILQRQSPILLPHPTAEGFHLLQFCHENFLLKIQSLDGFGRQAALQNYVRFIATREASPDALKPGVFYEVACLPADVQIGIPLNDSMHEPGKIFAYARGMNEPDPEACRQEIIRFLRNSKVPGISFILDPNYRIYAAENFYYFNQYVNGAADSKFSASEFWEKGKIICSENTVAGVSQLIHAEAAPEKRISACFGLVFLSEFIQSVMTVSPDQLMKAVTSVKELETSFIVGSLLTELPLLLRDNSSQAGESSMPRRIDEL